MSEKTNPFLQPGNQFLAKYLSGLGAKPGKMSVAGIGLPEFGVTEKVVPTLFPNRNQYNKEVAEKNKELNKKGSLYGSNFGSAITSTIASLPQAPGKLIDKAKDFLDRYTKNPERWIPERIAQDLPATGDAALRGQERNDIKGKVINGVIRV